LYTAHSAGLAKSRQVELGVHYQVVAWLTVQLLRQEPEAAETKATQQILALPSVPLSIAKQLVLAGMRISHAQLLAAANNMVEGVEVWVQGQQQLSITSDISHVAVAICCGHDWVSGAKNTWLIHAGTWYY
jgi:hypothetical protein